jgi:transcriptional regulator with XRE-family HTH domain/predicted XRE-type DNA-binding protein
MTARAQQTAEARRWIGRRIRRRRLFLAMTQAVLARALGVTFQQVQKYEKGITNVTRERLTQICQHLEVTPDYFTPGTADAQADALEHFVQSPQGLALYRAMAGLNDDRTRAALIAAVAAFSDGQHQPEDAEASALASWLRHVAGSPGSPQHRKDVAAAVHAAKIEVAQMIGKTLRARKLTQKFAAGILMTDQARVSALARGDVAATSFEKLLRCLMLLGWDTNIAIARRPAGRRGKIAVTSGR